MEEENSIAKWAEALAGAGVLSGDEASAIRNALEEIREQGRTDPDLGCSDDLKVI